MPPVAGESVTSPRDADRAVAEDQARASAAGVTYQRRQLGTLRPGVPICDWYAQPADPSKPERGPFRFARKAAAALLSPDE